MADVNDPSFIGFDRPIDPIRITTSGQNTCALFASDAASLRMFTDKLERSIDGASNIARAARAAFAQLVENLAKVVTSLRRVQDSHAP
jgi:hypothetical protein